LTQLTVQSAEVTKVEMTVSVLLTDYIITLDDGSRVSMAIICLCDSLCVSVHTIKPKRLKLKSPNLAQE